MFQITIPIRLVNETNQREHWAVKAKRSKQQRYAAAAYLRTSSTGYLAPKIPSFPCVITITRIGKRKMDSDNLAISAKHIRDGIADFLKVNDGDESKVKWEYAQELRDYYAVKIEIRGMIPATVTGGK